MIKLRLQLLTFVGLFVLCCSVASAGEKLTLKDITAGKFRSKSMTEVRPMADGETYAQISDDGKRIVTYSFRTGQQTGVLFDATAVQGADIDMVEGYIMSPDNGRILIQTATKAIYRRSFTATYYIYNTHTNQLEPLSDGGPQQTPVFSPDANLIAFVRGNNVFLVDLLHGKAECQVTMDGKFNEVINGIPDWVYEEEFSTNSSMVFSADSRQIAWIRYDESAVKQYSMQLFKGQKPERSEFAEYPGDYTYKYPVPGQVNSKVSVHSYDIQSHQTKTIDVPLDTDGYIPRIKATSDPSKIAVFTMNRHQDQLRIYMANPLTAVCQLAIEDRVEKYIKEETLEDVQLTDKHILLPSERDGYNMMRSLVTLISQPIPMAPPTSK